MKKCSVLFLAVTLLLIISIVFLPWQIGYIPENATEKSIISIKQQKNKRKEKTN